jgi:hypothetical protein
VVDLAAPLNDRQHAVLRWIADGCRDGVMPDFTYKRTALALQDRRLVAVSRKGGGWRAEITDAGQHYLAHGTYPKGLFSGSEGLGEQGAPTPPSRTALPRRVPKRAGTPKNSARTKRLPPTEQLIADLVAAGGELRINRSVDRANYQVRVNAAIRFGKVPDGKLLVMEQGRNWQELVIRLEDPPEWMMADLAPVEVPNSLRKPHAVVAALKTDHDRLSMRGTVRTRALRLLQALVAEAEARGYGVALHRGRVERSRGNEEGVLQFTVGGHPLGVVVYEEQDRVPHVTIPVEQRRAEREPWRRIPAHDFVPSGRIAVKLTNGHEHRRSVWADGRSGQMEDHLPQILQELELRAAFAEARRLEEEQRTADERRRWEAAVENAKARLREAHRAQVLQRQLDDWKQVRELDEYLRAMEETIAGMESGEVRAAALKWCSWANEYRTSLDPLRGPIAMPTPPDATAENLEPFLGGWSFYGPHRSRGF